MSKLINMYPVIRQIKEKLKENPDVSADQIKGYERKVTNVNAKGRKTGAILMTHVELLQNKQNYATRKQRQHQEEKKERERLEALLRHKSAEYDKLKTRIIDTFGVKSTEYELIFPGEKKLQGSDTIYDTTPEGMMNYIKKHNS